MQKLNFMEIYKNINGFEGLYQVSNKGNVKSLVNNKGVAREKVLKPVIGNGYKRVRLFKDKTSKLYSVHRLVANAFLHNPNNYPCVNHKDECRTNNVVENLEWCTHKYNSNYGTSIERTRKKNIKKTYQYTKDYKLICVYDSVKQASDVTNIDHRYIASCCRGDRKTAKGFIFSYNHLSANPLRT